VKIALNRGRLREFFCGAFLLWILLSLACSGTPKDREAPLDHLVVLHTNDTHGHPVKFFHHPAPDVGGLPARATLVAKIREKNRNVLLLDAGDLNTGRAESNYFQARPDIEGYNYMGYDAMVLGNHEFDHPMEVLEKQMSWARFPFLSANVKNKAGMPISRPYIIKSFHGFRVAVFGLTTKDTEVIGNPAHVKDLIFQDEIETARNLVPELRRKADVVVALVHMGIYASSERGSRRLASEVPGIDLIVDGHTHTKLDAPIIVPYRGGEHRTPIVQAWKWGLLLGKVDLWIREGRVVDFAFEPIPVNLKGATIKPDGSKAYRFIGEEIQEDGVLARLLQPYVDHVVSALSEVVGYAEGDFFVKDMRNEETALGDLVADSMFWYMKHLGVDFAIQNGGGIRTGLPAGPITKRSVHEMLPFDNTVVVLTLKGSDVRDLLNYLASITRGKGAFPQVSMGIQLTIDRGAGISWGVLIGGKPLDMNRRYRIATNSYLAAGGDGYRGFLSATERYDSSVFQRDVFIGYLQSLGGRIKPTVEGRITVSGEPKRLSWLKWAA